VASDDTSKIATRYSRSLFELASDQRKLDAVEANLASLKNAIASGDALPDLFASPLPPRLAKARAMDALLAKMKAEDVTRSFVKQLAHANRLAALPAIIAEFERLMTAHRGEMVVDVKSASALSAAQLSELSGSLTKKYGRKVHLNPSVDPSLIGGLVVKAGGTMIDNSIKNKLARLERALKTQHA
jgi:F-type H+-transporting ATPase subunit delta